MTKERSNRKFDFSKSDVSRFDFTKDEKEDGVNGASGNELEPDGVEGKGNGKGGIVKVFGGIAAVALSGLLCYGAYSYFTSPDKQNNRTTTEQVEGSTGISDENVTKDASNTKTAEPSRTKTVNNDGTTNVEGVTTEVSSPGSELDQGGSMKLAEPSKATTPASTSAQQATSDSQSVALSGSLEQKAKEVIRGSYGNGEVRKQKLGEQYLEVQNRVNEIYREKGLL